MAEGRAGAVDLLLLLGWICGWDSPLSIWDGQPVSEWHGVSRLPVTCCGLGLGVEGGEGVLSCLLIVSAVCCIDPGVGESGGAVHDIGSSGVQLSLSRPDSFAQAPRGG